MGRRIAVVGIVLGAVTVMALQPWRGTGTKTPPPVAAQAALRAPVHPDLFRPRPKSPVVLENRHPGTHGWRIDPKSPHGVEGFAAPVSPSPGQTVRLFVRTKAPVVRGAIYRLGWYRGTGARLIASLPPARGDPQSPCPVLEPRHTIECRWRPTFRVPIGRSWVSGTYLAKLTDSAGAQSWIPFTVREAVPRAPVLFVSAVTTWQAYNMWGGRSLYRGPSPTPCVVCPTRSRAASFDRPYEWPGAGRLFLDEFQAIELIEEHGLDVAYATSADLHEGIVGIAQRRVFLSVGHDEYYSTAMRTALEKALAGGTSLAFLGGNDMYRHIRFEASPLGPDRIEVNYKRPKEDPVIRTDPAESTGNWRSSPLRNPEQLLLGAQYDCCPGKNRCPRTARAWVPTGRPSWLFRGTGFHAGVAVPRMIVGEYDRIYSDVPSPPGVVVVGHGSIPCGAHRMAQDSTFYVAPSGGGVFDIGLEYAACRLGPTLVGRCTDNRVDRRLRRLVLNLIDGMIQRIFA